MPRVGREQSGTGIYHVMLRGINRQDIFEEPEDYWTFIRILSTVQERLEDDLVTRTTICHIYAYCLMPNHVHLLLGEKRWKVGDVMKSIASSYVFYYNKKYGRVGHLFQDRFRSEPCNDSEYFFTLFRYIHQNPVKAGLVGTAREYEYSSWPNDYLGMGRERVCYTLAATNRYGMKQLTEWIDEPLSGNLKCIDMDERKVVADEVVRELLLQKSGVLTVTEFRLLPKQVQKDLIRDVMIEIGSGPRQMSRVSGMSYNIIQYMWKNNEEQQSKGQVFD